MRLTLAARLPFSLSAVVRSHGWARLAPFDTDAPTDGLTYVVCLDSDRVSEMFFQEAPGGVSVVTIRTIMYQGYSPSCTSRIHP